MIKSFTNIKNSVLTALGVTASSVETTTDTDIEMRVNEAQDIIFYDRDWEWRKRRYFFTTRKPYSTGTITVTQGSKTVTGSSTVWEAIHALGYIRINTKLFKVDTVDSTTQITLMANYPDATESAASYKVVFPEMYLHPEIAAISEVKFEGEVIDVKRADRMLLGRHSIGEPEEITIDGVSAKDFHTDGTVAVTNGSATVTGTSTNWTTSMVDLPFRVDEFGEIYWVKSVASATSLTLHKGYRGDTGSGKAYILAPAGSPLVQVGHTPDDYYYLEFVALLKAVTLVGGTDYSLIPEHTPLIHASRWLVVQDMQDKNPVRIQQARADFERTLKQLQSMYKVVTKIVWRSGEERAIRATGGITRFDPLSRRRF